MERKCLGESCSYFDYIPFKGKENQCKCDIRRSASWKLLWLIAVCGTGRGQGEGCLRLEDDAHVCARGRCFAQAVL